MIELTPEQDAAIEAVRGWYDSRENPFQALEPFRLFGPAGTGKTTLARQIAERLGLTDVAYGAFTGKAASVLASKGMPATTIHSAIYQPTWNAGLRAEHREIQRELAHLPASGRAERHRELTRRVVEIEAELRKPSFELNPMSDWAHADLIVLDEVSMVDAALAADIESFGVPVLVLGDPEQLPPVGGGGHYTLGLHPDVLLTEIHRQALESPVLELATRIRLSQDLELGVRGEEREVASISRALEHEQVLCWKNETRWKLIARMRAKAGRNAGEVVVGDRVMCLVNNKEDLGVLNGQQFDVLDVRDRWTLLLRECGTGIDRWIEVYPDGFRDLDGEKALKDKRAWRGPVGAFTYADAVTVHKAQGSEYGSVYVVDETPAMIDMTARREGRAAGVAAGRRWLYTAVTRARDSVTIARLRGR